MHTSNSRERQVLRDKCRTLVDPRRRVVKHEAAATISSSTTPVQAFLLTLATLTLGAGQALADAGNLDPAFGVGGQVTTDGFPGNVDQAYGVAVQADGKIVAAGQAGNNFALARYNPDGTLDADFGAGGLVTMTGGWFRDVMIQPDGRIIAAGWNFAVARYNTDGTLDDDFATNGLVTTIGFNNAFAYAIVLQSDGKITLAGRSAGDYALARVNTDGSLDDTFGTGGKVTTNFFGENSNGAWGVTLEPDGKIVVAGEVYDGFSTHFGLARYNADGSLDNTFGTGGKVTTDFGIGANEARAVLVQPDGKIIAAGQAVVFNPQGYDFGLARYNADGSLDSTFGVGGLVTTDFALGGNPPHDRAWDARLQPDGKIVAVGTAETSTGVIFALARYNTDGTLDGSFGTGGMTTTNFGFIRDHRGS